MATAKPVSRGRKAGSTLQPQMTAKEFYEANKGKTLAELKTIMDTARVKCSWPTCKKSLSKDKLSGILMLAETTKYCDICKAEIAKLGGQVNNLPKKRGRKAKQGKG